LENGAVTKSRCWNGAELRNARSIQRTKKVVPKKNKPALTPEQAALLEIATQFSLSDLKKAMIDDPPVEWLNAALTLGLTDLAKALGAIPLEPNEACLRWLEAEMWKSKHRRPKPKTQYYAEAQERFGVSWRRFDHYIWPTAIKNTGATGWSNPGPSVE
jgi:hypothetical protein